MAMTRTHWRVTHQPVALVFQPDQGLTLLAVGRGMTMIGGLGVAAAVQALRDHGDASAYMALEAAMMLPRKDGQAPD